LQRYRILLLLLLLLLLTANEYVPGGSGTTVHKKHKIRHTHTQNNTQHTKLQTQWHKITNTMHTKLQA
jgi:hypothetical protein